MTLVGKFDDAVERLVDRIRGPRLDPIFYVLSSAADHSLLWVALGALRSARAGEPELAIRVAAVLGAESALTNGPIKFAFRRLRPGHEVPGGPLPYGLHRPVTSAFPSGHATSAFTAAMVLSTGRRSRTLLLGLATAVALSRVYVRLHHPSDVLAGSALGLAFGGFAVRSGWSRPRAGGQSSDP